MTLVCFDSNFVIWGIRRKATPGQEDNIPKVVYLIGQLEKQDKQILIPSIVLAEVLGRVPAELHGAFIQSMERDYIVAPFDSRAAVHFARMWQKRGKDSAFTRDETKADYLIAAIAVAHGCEKIYSNDGGLIKFASDYVPVVNIDEISVPPEQATLF